MTADMVAGRGARLADLRVDGGDVLWLESRPSENGRTTALRWREGTMVSELTPQPFDIGTRVHEYGGGAYAVRDGVVVASNRSDGFLWVFAPGAAPRVLCAVDGLRFADLVFLPDGTTVLAIREDHRSPGEPRAAIVAFSLTDTSDAAANPGQVLIEGPDFLAAPRPDPAGRSLAWVAWNHPSMPWERTTLMRARLTRDDAGRLSLDQPVSVAEDGSTIAPVWDGERLIACSDAGGWWTPVAYDARAHALTSLEAEIGGPAWQFGETWVAPLGEGRYLALAIEAGVARCVLIDRDGVSRDVRLGHPAGCPLPLGDGSGRFAWIDAPPDALPAVAIGRPDAPITRLTTSADDNALDPEAVARAVPIRFEGPAGEAYALFYPPTSPDACVPEGEKPPLVVMIHGGPTARADTALSFKVQWWTSRGFAVVDVNYAGSTGFGRRFRQALDGQWGERDVADCIAACRDLVSRGWVDPARIVIRGSSAGGLTVLNALAAPGSPFAAGTSLYGVTDLSLLARDTHKFEARYLDTLVGPWPEARATYEARSPCHHPEAIGSPVLFLHGQEDLVVPIAQAHAMAAGLRRHGVAAAMVAFAGERHGFRSGATLRTVFETELAFYGAVLGFTPPGVAEVPIPFLP
ncbi:peptidase S9 [Ameyamaea chiangmaiensis NBRC 103196]|nr:peptidase S9 [Ameyamaea chiangmaiensis NBRC 103196]